jgi:uncharacterized protein YjeT (DUF2065 family)
MSLDLLLATIGLVLIIEGLMPFIAPAQWRQTISRVAQLKDDQIRLFGLGALVLGCLLLLL